MHKDRQHFVLSERLPAVTQAWNQLVATGYHLLLLWSVGFEGRGHAVKDRELCWADVEAAAGLITRQSLDLDHESLLLHFLSQRNPVSSCTWWLSVVFSLWFHISQQTILLLSKQWKKHLNVQLRFMFESHLIQLRLLSHWIQTQHLVRLDSDRFRNRLRSASPCWRMPCFPLDERRKITWNEFVQHSRLVWIELYWIGAVITFLVCNGTRPAGLRNSRQSSRESISDNE